jgi:hypothetical protein
MTNARDKANIPVLNFQSKGIDDNATSTAITIDSSQNVSFAEDISTGNNGVLNILDGDGDISGKLANQSSSAHSLEIIADPSNSGANSNMIFKIDNTERMRIDSSGNVGIGTTSPLVKLHILGTENNADTQAIRLSENSTQGGFIKYDGNVNELQLGGFNSGENTGIRIARNDATTMFNTNGAERMRIDDSGNVGIGNTVASAINSANGTGNLVVGSGSGTEGITIYSGTTGEGTLQFADGTSGSAAYIGQINYNHSSNDMSFTAGGTERMRLLGTGNVGIGTSSPASELEIEATTPEIRIDATASSGRNYKIHSDGDELYIEGIGSSGSLKIGEDGSYGVSIDLGSGVISSASNAGSHTRLLLIKDKGNAGSNRNFIEFHNNSDSTAGRIEHNGSTTVSYITSSDYRLKENVSYDFDATTRLKQLKPARFNFIEEPNKTVDGFLAHEVSDIVPEAISGEKDELQVWKEGEELPEGVSVGDNKLDENGNTIMQIQGIDQSKLVPLLVKTIQELEARITALEANNP